MVTLIKQMRAIQQVDESIIEAAGVPPLPVARDTFFKEPRGYTRHDPADASLFYNPFIDGIASRLQRGAALIESL